MSSNKYKLGLAKELNLLQALKNFTCLLIFLKEGAYGNEK